MFLRTRIFLLIHSSSRLIDGRTFTQKQKKVDCNYHCVSSFVYSLALSKYISNCWPVKVKAMIMIDPPFIWKAMWAIIKPFLAYKLQKRVKKNRIKKKNHSNKKMRCNSSQDQN